MDAGPERSDSLASWFRRVACLPVLFVLALAGLINILGQNRVMESQIVLAVLNTLFSASVSILIASLAAREYVVSGSRAVLALGCGALSFAIANVVTAFFLPRLGVAIAIYNLSVCLSGAFFVAAASFCLFSKRNDSVRGAMWILGLAYGGVIGLIVLLVTGTWDGRVPSFYSPGAGPTVTRHVVMLLCVLEFILSGVGFGILYVRRNVPSLFWYCLSLTLIALGLALVAVSVPGTPLSWLGRSAQYLGAIYLLIAIMTEGRGTKGVGITIELAYRESEERYHALVELLPDAVMVLTNGKCVFANKACLKLFKVSLPGGLIGHDLVELAEQADRTLVSERLLFAASKWDGLRAEFRIRRFDGSIAFVEMTTGRIRYEGKTSWLAILRDITDRRNREADLKRLNRVLKATSAGDSAMMRATREGDYLQEVCRIVADCGYPMVWIGYPKNDERKSIWPAAWAGLDENALFNQNLSWSDEKSGANPTGMALRSGKTVLFRFEQRTLPYASALVLPLLADGSAFGALTIYSREPDQFTEQEVQLLTELAKDLAYGIGAIRLRNSHARSLEALKRSEERYRLLVEYSPDAVFVQRNNRIVFVNPAGLRLLGANEMDTILGKSPLDLFHVDCHCLLQQNMEDLEAGRRVPHAEVRLIRVDGGGVLDVDMTFASLESDEGPSVQLILRDITERKAYENALRLSSLELSRSNQDLEQFAHVTSHDLKEPLRMVTGFMSLLNERLRGRLDEKSGEYMGFITDAAGRMQRLIDDLLSYSRVGRAGVKGRVRVADAVTSAMRNLRISLEESGATVTFDPLPEVSANSMELTQLFQNLLGNALKFRGEEAPTIHIGACLRGREWFFFIRDNGIGIDPQFNERIFQIFNRLHTSDEYPGTGVGLAICKKVVERHGGKIWVESKPGLGSTFWFTLPAHECEAA